MKKQFTFLLISLFPLPSIAMMAKKTHPPHDPLKVILSHAFESFGMSADSYSIHVHNPMGTPDTDTNRWSAIGTELEFLNDVTSPPARFEFAAYWAAAYIKHNGYAKTELCYWGSLASIIFGSTAASLALMNRNSPDACIAACGSLCAGMLTTLVADAPTKIQNCVERFYLSRALDQACATLIAQRKFEPIAQYYALCASRHAGVKTKEDHAARIQKILASANLELISIARANSLEVRIINPSISPNHQLASAFCSLPSLQVSSGKFGRNK